uniref:K Homology domain-containing protein n=1 Tax=Mantoniella antarctica TaxID=81844 RepID=A0A7S0X234_9CHLO
MFEEEATPVVGLSSGSGGGPTPGDVVFRILCNKSKTGQVIGKGGSVIKQLRDETLSRIKVENMVPGSDDRVIVISAPDTPGEESSPALDAAVRIYAVMMATTVMPGGDDADAAAIAAADAIVGAEAAPEVKASVRLLIPKSQTGCLIGKGGIIINEMREQTGAQIRVCNKDQIPVCALQGDDMVQITGESSAVLCGFHAVLAKLRATPPREALSGQIIGNSAQQVPGMPGAYPTAGSKRPLDMMQPNAQGQFMGAGAPQYMGQPQFGGQQQYMGGYSAPMFPGQAPPVPASRAPSGSAGNQVLFRVLCPGNRTGSVIGRSGDTIKALREQSGAKIKVEDAIPGSEERVVAISCAEDGVSPMSPAQVALLRVYACIAEPPQGAGAAAYTGPPPFRLLIPGQQVGCLIGKGGAIIKAMREESGAHIKILPHEQLPGCALEGDELLEIGAASPHACAAAVQAVSTRLRAYVPRPDAPIAMPLA